MKKIHFALIGCFCPLDLYFTVLLVTAKTEILDPLMKIDSQREFKHAHSCSMQLRLKFQARKSAGAFVL
jgi:hypothetical protein